MNGSLWIAAKFRPSWTSPWLELALAHRGHRDLAGLPDLRRERDPDGVEHLGRDRRRQRHEVVRDVAVVAGHLAAARREVDRLGVLRGQDVLGAHPERQARRDRAVERRDPVLLLLERPGDRRLRALVALAADHERDPAGAVEDPHPLVDRARRGDDPVHADQVGVGQPDRRRELRDALRRLRGCGLRLGPSPPSASSPSEVDRPAVDGERRLADDLGERRVGVRRRRRSPRASPRA